MGLLEYWKKIEPDKKSSPMMHTAYDAFFTFLFTPNKTTSTIGSVHIRDGMDLKRTMTIVVIAMQLALIFGIFNIGHQHFAAMGMYTDNVFDGFHLKFAHGLIKMLPMVIVSHVVGLGIEFYYAAKKGHGVEEGFLVSGILIPMIMPPDLPLWILALGVAFAVIFAKEVFGGTGMNIWNVALVARVFVFFAYPGAISGDGVWVSGFDGLVAGATPIYGWAHSLSNGIFELMGLSTFGTGQIVDGFSGATPLGLAANGGWEAVSAQYSDSQLWWGLIPGSVAEVCKPAIIIGAIVLIVSKIASYRIMIGLLAGSLIMGILFNIWGALPGMSVPWYQHLSMGGLLFAMAFMATDPVTAAGTNMGKWIYGFFIGVMGMIVRVINPAYPEGWMLAILFMNSLAPLIDYFVIQSNIKRRLSRV